MPPTLACLELKRKRLVFSFACHNNRPGPRNSWRRWTGIKTRRSACETQALQQFQQNQNPPTAGVLRLRQLPSQRTPRNTTPELVTTSADTRDLRLSATAASAISSPHPPPTSRAPFPPQLSRLSDSHIAPGDHPSGPLRMPKNTQLRPLSSFGKNEMRLRGDGGVRVVEDFRTVKVI
jgi:hypothetical protein